MSEKVKRWAVHQNDRYLHSSDTNTCRDMVLASDYDAEVAAHEKLVISFRELLAERDALRRKVERVSKLPGKWRLEDRKYHAAELERALSDEEPRVDAAFCSVCKTFEAGEHGYGKCVERRGKPGARPSRAPGRGRQWHNEIFNETGRRSGRDRRGWWFL